MLEAGSLNCIIRLISTRRFSKTLVIGHYMTEDARSATVLGQDLDRFLVLVPRLQHGTEVLGAADPVVA